MRKSSTNGLMTLNFWRSCIAAFLLFVIVYMTLPFLPFYMVPQLHLPVSRLASLYLAFVVAMYAVGPFHAYLGDTYKRKGILVNATLLMVLSTVGYAFAKNYFHVLLLAIGQGAGFGLAVTAGITVAIDITTSVRRSAGNMVYAWMARMGMLVGAGLGALLFRLYDAQTLLYATGAIGVLCLYFSSRIYVAFRAPIGMKCLNIDRFLLPRGWLPALNLMLVAWSAGVLLPLLLIGSYSYLPIVALAVLTLLVIPFTGIFVKLSHHCQRGTANTTCHLAIDSGLLLGLAAVCHFMDLQISLAGTTDAAQSPQEQVMAMPLISSGEAVIIALLLFVLTFSYYKRYKVR